MPDFRIFKYTIDLNKRTQCVFPPEDASILSVQMQHGECQIWVLCDASRPEKSRTIETLPTGAYVKSHEHLVFLGTIQVDGGSLVFHIFERTS